MEIVAASNPEADFQIDYRTGLATNSGEVTIARIQVPKGLYRRVIYHNAGPDGVGGFEFDGKLYCKAGGRNILIVPFFTSNATPSGKPIVLLGTAGAIGSATVQGQPVLQVANAISGNLLESGGIGIDLGCDTIELIGRVVVSGTTGQAYVACLSSNPVA